MSRTSWSNQIDIGRLDALRVDRAGVMSGPECASREHDRRRYVNEPHLRLGVAVADTAMEGPRQMPLPLLARLVPQLGTHRLPPGDTERGGILGRMSGVHSRQARQDSMDERWTAIAQITAQEAQHWIRGRSPHGLDARVEGEIRRGVVDATANEFKDDGRPLMSRMNEDAGRMSRRTALFLSMGPDVEEAVDRGAAERADRAGIDPRGVAHRMRSDMAAARIGAVPPERLVAMANSPEYAALDALPDAPRVSARPTFGRTWATPEAMQKDVAAAMSSRTDPVPAQWREPDGGGRAATAPARGVAAFAARAHLGRG